jgi:formylmethanofuran dehydrogenase subunit D
MNIEQEYNQSARSPATGKLYMPSLKWGGWMVTPEGARHSFGSPLYNSKGGAIVKAKEDATKYGATVYLFSRAQGGCKLVATITG